MTLMTLIIFLLGLAVGSFLNVVIDRLPAGEDIIRRRSHCDHCKRVLTWRELIPVISWIIQAGKSRCCCRKLSFQYPIVEVFTGFGFVFLYHGLILNYALSVILFSCFLVLFMTDIKTELLPSPVLAVAGIAAFIRACVIASSVQDAVLLYFLPAGAAALFFFLIRFFSKGKAMGDGDVPLAGIIGLVSGYPGAIVSFYVAFLTGAAAGVILILGRLRTLKSHIAFGPFLIFGAVIAYLYGGQVIDLWQHYILPGSRGFP